MPLACGPVHTGYLSDMSQTNVPVVLTSMYVVVGNQGGIWPDGKQYYDNKFNSV